jgi:hypothetical protein
VDKVQTWWDEPMAPQLLSDAEFALRNIPERFGDKRAMNLEELDGGSFVDSIRTQQTLAEQPSRKQLKQNDKKQAQHDNERDATRVHCDD